MPGPSIRHVGTTNGTSTYKVIDDKVEGGEATVVVFGDPPTIRCLTCRVISSFSALTCKHTERIFFRLRDGR
jgi:hypothetical protein